mmetsp:Transcript_16448/g.49276  ORF Transcript_16448/g.49276 Transcript_16448/m.49276 type:complete len:400 (-) Transcript_16448:1454-2653(-)
MAASSSMRQCVCVALMTRPVYPLWGPLQIFRRRPTSPSSRCWPPALPLKLPPDVPVRPIWLAVPSWGLPSTLGPWPGDLRALRMSCVWSTRPGVAPHALPPSPVVCALPPRTRQSRALTQKKPPCVLTSLECRKRLLALMNFTVPDLSDILPRLTSTMSPMATGWRDRSLVTALREPARFLMSGSRTVRISGRSGRPPEVSTFAVSAPHSTITPTQSTSCTRSCCSYCPNLSMPWFRSLDNVRSRANSLASAWDESSIMTATPASSTTSSIPVSPANCPATAFTRSPATKCLTASLGSTSRMRSLSRLVARMCRVPFSATFSTKPQAPTKSPATTRILSPLTKVMAAPEEPFRLCISEDNPPGSSPSSPDAACLKAVSSPMGGRPGRCVRLRTGKSFSR